MNYMTPEIHGVAYPTYPDMLMSEPRWTVTRNQAWTERTTAFYMALYDPARQAGRTYDFTDDCIRQSYATFDLAAGLILESYGCEPDIGRANANAALEALFAEADEAYIRDGAAEALLQELIRQARRGRVLGDSRPLQSYAEAVVANASGLGDWVSDPEDYFGSTSYPSVRGRYEGTGDKVINKEHTPFTLRWVHGDEKIREEV